ncbi:DUF1353 domain-containing protein [Chloroflexota bacterium]
MMNKSAKTFSELQVEVLSTGRHFRLIKVFIYSPSGSKAISVPADFETDFASIPGFATIFVPKLGRYTQPSVVHDYLCREANSWGERSKGDTVFRQAMEAVGVGVVKRWAMYVAVLLAGMVAWASARVGIKGRVGRQYDEDEEARKAVTGSKAGMNPAETEEQNSPV